jgi:hypothetical protein
LSKGPDLLTIGPLEPGTYVIEVTRDQVTAEDLGALQEHLDKVQPEGVHFLILGPGLRIARNDDYQAVTQKASDATSI